VAHAPAAALACVHGQARSGQLNQQSSSGGKKENQMRLYRASFVAGFAAGFVAGARSGKETYDQIVKYIQTAWEHPTVQQARGTAQTQAQKVGGQLADRMPQVAQSAAQSLGSKIPGMRPRNGDSEKETTETSQYATTKTGGASRPGDDLPT
jgi:hypothetical protein